MTRRQKDSVEKFILNWKQEHPVLTAEDMVKNVVTHIPFANSHHASGVISGMARRKLITCVNGIIY